MSNSQIATRGNEAALRQAAADRDVGTAALTPPVDVIEDDAGISVIADLPGVRREDLNIRVDGDTLTLEASVSLGASADSINSVYAEVRAPRYRRSFTLSRELDSAHIAASLKDGVLNLRVPKLERARPRRIEVQAS
jgi:HSP20 family protein